MKNSRFFVGALIVSVSSAAFAWDSPSGGYAIATVARIELWGSGRFNITLTGSPSLCSNTTGGNTVGWVTPETADVTQDGAKAMLSLILSARASGQTVKVFAFNRTGGGCDIGAMSTPN